MPNEVAVEAAGIKQVMSYIGALLGGVVTSQGWQKYRERRQNGNVGLHTVVAAIREDGRLTREQLNHTENALIRIYTAQTALCGAEAQRSATALSILEGLRQGATGGAAPKGATGEHGEKGDPGE